MNRRIRGYGGMLLVVLIVAYGGFILGRMTLGSLEEPAGDPVPMTYSVELGSVEQLQNFNATAEWHSTPAATAGLSGTVTSVIVAPGVPFNAEVGSALYTVDLLPVTVFAGPVPAFRSMQSGIRGDDVAQLQAGLAELGFASGSIDGRFDQSVETAVRNWQRSIDVDVSGVVAQGAVRFLPALPVRVALSSSVTVGASIAAEQPAVLLLDAAPTFTITLDVAQSDLVPLRAAVNISYTATDLWIGTVASSQVEAVDGQSSLSLTLTAPDGGPPCADMCAQIPVGVQTYFPAQVIAVPNTTGPVVPLGAIRTDAAGQTFLQLSDGRRVATRILASAQGRAVVDGVEPGDVIRLDES